MKYKLVACGGTFDFLHEGHKAFLRFVFSKGETVIIGLTADDFIHVPAKKVSVFSERKKLLEEFLRQENLLARAKIIRIDDIYGPTLDSNLSLDAVAATEDTKKGADEINRKRRQLGLPPVAVVIMPMVKGDDFIISSSRIRQGTADQKGNPFVLPEYFSKSYFLPKSLRSTLHEPFGKIYENSLEEIKQLNPNLIAAIGDITTRKFNQYGIKQKLSVVDFVVERKKTFENLSELGFNGNEKIISVLNPSGSLTPSVWNGVSEVIGQLSAPNRFVLFVEGEEDLVFIPLLLSLPLGFYLFYGQPHQGLVRVDVTLENKEKMREIFSKFSTSY